MDKIKSIFKLKIFFYLNKIIYYCQTKQKQRTVYIKSNEK